MNNNYFVYKQMNFKMMRNFLLTIYNRMSTNRFIRNDPIRKLLFGKHHRNNKFRQEHQWVLKQISEK